VLKITQNNGRRKNIREEANIFIYVQQRINYTRIKGKIVIRGKSTYTNHKPDRKNNGIF
jgi:hypothetical protein